MADGPQSEAPSGSFLRALTICGSGRPAYATVANSVGLSVSMVLSRIWSTASATSLSRSVLCFNFS